MARKTEEPLARYWAKRDFAKTTEPRGEHARSGKALSFVIQKHAATRLHYDFRLELEHDHESVGRDPRLAQVDADVGTDGVDWLRDNYGEYLRDPSVVPVLLEQNELLAPQGRAPGL
jgi:hypothetical protein